MLKLVIFFAKYRDQTVETSLSSKIKTHDTIIIIFNILVEKLSKTCAKIEENWKLRQNENKINGNQSSVHKALNLNNSVEKTKFKYVVNCILYAGRAFY